MRKPRSHLVTLLCAAVLLLPQGWCCFFAPTVKADTASVEASPCCCCDPKPAPVPAPALPPRLCCCPERDLGSPPDPVSPPDLHLLGLLTLAVSAVADASLPGPVQEEVAPPGRPIHVLRCLWLC